MASMNHTYTVKFQTISPVRCLWKPWTWFSRQWVATYRIEQGKCSHCGAPHNWQSQIVDARVDRAFAAAEQWVPDPSECRHTPPLADGVNPTAAEPQSVWVPQNRGSGQPIDDSQTEVE